MTAFLDGVPFDGNELPDEVLWEACNEIPDDAKNQEALKYLAQVKMSILSPKDHGSLPMRSLLVTNSKTRPQVYHGLKKIYLDGKSPLVAYALVCPALFMEDKEIIPELIECISKNAPLKKRFDQVYPLWSKRLAPDF